MKMKLFTFPVLLFLFSQAFSGILVYSDASDGFLNIRASTTTKSEILGKLVNNGTPAVFLLKSGDWIKVNFNGVIGYVHESAAKLKSSDAKQGGKSSTLNLKGSFLKKLKKDVQYRGSDSYMEKNQCGPGCNYSFDEFEKKINASEVGECFYLCMGESLDDDGLIECSGDIVSSFEIICMYPAKVDGARRTIKAFFPVWELETEISNFYW